MSFITVIFQSIVQAISEIIPVSEAGHSAIFNDFSGRLSGACSQLTGTIHIGIALGIIICFWKMFLKETFSVFNLAKNLFSKKIKGTTLSGIEKFTLSTFLSFAPFLFLLIPVGEKQNLFTKAFSTSVDGNVFLEGLMFILLSFIIYLCYWRISLQKNNDYMGFLKAFVIGISTVIATSFAGLSGIGVAFAIGIFFNVKTDVAFRYAFAINMPIILVKGIIEIIVCEKTVSVLMLIIAVIISSLVTFFSIKFFQWIIRCNKLFTVAIYDLSIGVITTIIGIFQFFVR